MWVVTVAPVAGFFSAVQHADDPDLLFVRTRASQDATDLHGWLRKVLKAPAEIITYAASDYPYRVLTTKPAWSAFLARAAMSIDYGNVKDAVAERQSLQRARVYGDAWGVFLRIEAEDRDLDDLDWFGDTPIPFTEEHQP